MGSLESSGRRLGAIYRRLWIFDIIVDNFGDPFRRVFTDPKPSGPQNSILEGLTDLSASHMRALELVRHPPFGHFR